MQNLRPVKSFKDSLVNSTYMNTDFQLKIFHRRNKIDDLSLYVTIKYIMMRQFFYN